MTEEHGKAPEESEPGRPHQEEVIIDFWSEVAEDDWKEEE